MADNSSSSGKSSENKINKSKKIEAKQSKMKI